MTSNFDFAKFESTPPAEKDLVNLANYSHPKLLDTSEVPSFDSTEEFEKFCARVQMNYLFLNILMKFGLNIDNDEDTERADQLLTTMVSCECSMSQMLNKLFAQGMISETTLFNTRDCLFDILLEHPDLIAQHTDLRLVSARERRERRAPSQDDIAEALVELFGGTSAGLNQKLSKILEDKLFGNADASDNEGPDGNANAKN